jgi:methionyl-tRNA formyltransferase
MKFIIVGDAAKLTKHITDQGGEVVKLYSKGDENKLRDQYLEIPEADYLLNFFSPVILKSNVLNRLKNGALNVHNGKLPQYAGIHVHQWAIRNGEIETAVTIHKMTTDIDLGDIVAERSVMISPNDTGLSLFRKTVKEGLALMTDVVDQLLKTGGELVYNKQDISERHVYLHKDALDPLIEWPKPADTIRNFIRAGSYYPLQSPTYTATIPSKAFGDIQIIKAEVEDHSGASGCLLDITDGKPLIGCGKQSLRITSAKISREVELDWSQVFPIA